MIKKITLIVVIISAIILASCRKDDIFNDSPSFRLEFSIDTLYFDTVFTTVGSVTLPIKVYNRSNKSVKISSLWLGGKTNSNFRINVNGMSGVNFSDVEIYPKDSIFIFAEVTVDPQNSNNLVVIEDSICFITNGNKQKVMLVACGQDAYFHFPDHPASQYLPPYSLTSGTWQNDKPHVVYGLCVVDENETLIIPSGTKVYMHNDAILWIYDGGTLKINGEKDNEVVFQGDRLDDYYKDLPGMWGKIWLSAGSVNNTIDYAIIKKGRIGIHVDTLGASSNPTLVLKNTIIDNMTTACLVAQGSWVKAENCVFGSAGYYSVLLNIGGNYDFRHCTVGNFWKHGKRSTSAVALNNYYKDIYENIQLRDLKCYFGNCILYGSDENELFFDKYKTGGVFDFSFENCLIKTSMDITQSGFSNCLKNKAPLFVDYIDFNIENTSPAVDVGNVSATGTIATDILGNPRIVGTAPDLGAYEVQ